MPSKNKLSTQDIITAVYDLDLDDLKRVAEAVRNVFDLHRQRVKFNLRTGDRVEFTSPKYGNVIRGQLVRHMRKNAQVLADSGQLWRVGISLLRREEPQRVK